MKKIVISILISFSSIVNAQISIGTNTPDARLDIRASNQANPSNRDGIIIPKIDIFPTNNPTAAQNGMLVFLTTATAENPVGFYYWNNNLAIWRKVDTGNVKYWEKEGNSGTTNGTDFIGTTDNQDLDLRTNSVIRTRITQKGQIEVLNTGQSVFIGEEAGESENLNVNQNVYVGFRAGYINYNNRYVTAYGHNAIYYNDHGDYNTANGYNTLYSNNDGGYNTAYGFQAIYENSDGSYNTAIGYNTLYNLDGNFITSIGYSGAQFSYHPHIADYTTQLGYITVPSSQSAFKENTLYIGNDISVLPNENRISIGNSIFVGSYPYPHTNEVGISVQNPKERLDVDGALRLKTTANTNAGTIRWSGTDFEGYNGTKWLSLTKKNSIWNNGSNEMNENQIVEASDGIAGDYFGYSVAISGDYAIIGASRDVISGNNFQGSAYIFRKEGNIWIEEDKIVASDGAASDLFGTSVSISGDYAIVGAYLDDVNVSDQGSAYIFKRTGTSWNQEAKITANDWGASDRFGFSVSISGDYAAIGSYLDDIAGNNHQGSTYIFKRNGTSWSQEAKITASDGAASDYFGISVSISGDYTIIGAYRDDINSNNDQGSAYIFKRDGTTWNQEAKITASDGSTSDYFGISVSIHNAYALIGAPRADTNLGAAYVFKREGAIWTQESKLSASDDSTNDSFGKSVSIYDNCAIIGSNRDDITTNTDQGSSYVFMKTDALWTEKVKLIASNGASDDFFGSTVAIYGNTIIIGAYGAEKTYFFNR
jgi:hypothetical protein